MASSGGDNVGLHRSATTDVKHRQAGLGGRRFHSNLGRRLHTKLAVAEDGRSGFHRPPSILALPSSATDLQHLYPLPAPVCNKLSSPLLPFEQIGVKAVWELRVNSRHDERIWVGWEGDGGYGVSAEAIGGRWRRRWGHGHGVETQVLLYGGRDRVYLEVGASNE
jgi:hypothetical protein